ncbi:MAG: helix-turn-helix transcriptional regulator [Candidatus Eisenbacteria bacterium]|uniref:Helix-turn-helix transcriptional regulator n=1 Tax=Eiseniibacteriota bacterium TaxID=2212470 RepID=A0A9D6QKT2_UNCEI|nr:helix-turn-helix transcriptional regulator [Candidatus Eisenbacteria bacterium]MBI3540501.1 helix-turn-helix transcriptional regulator [Candidatus Eisenbacteria bacterium]
MTIVTAAEVGRRIRKIRSSRRLTLQQIARAAGLSATHLSEVERGRTSLTIGALVRIAAALGREPAYLIEPDERQDVAHQLFEMCPVLRPVPGASAAVLSPGIPGSRMFPYRIRFDAGCRSELTLDRGRTPAEGFYRVTFGAIECDFGDGSVRLGSGDSAQASFSRPHRLVSHGEDVSEVLAVLTGSLEKRLAR